MFKIAIVEDDNQAAESLIEHIRKYESLSVSTAFEIVRFDSGINFLDAFQSDFDIIFIDIQMPHMNGMDTARRIYEKDKMAVIIFVTSLRQYAIQGYEVNALDYMLKPVGYDSIADKLDKALLRIKKRPKAKTLILRENTIIRLDVSDIYYVEVIGHILTYHTVQGAYEMRGRLSDIAEELSEFGFSRCNKGYLVNMRHVQSIESNSVKVGKETLPISRGKAKSFMADFLSYLQGGGV